MPKYIVVLKHPQDIHKLKIDFSNQGERVGKPKKFFKHVILETEQSYDDVLRKQYVEDVVVDSKCSPSALDSSRTTYNWGLARISGSTDITTYRYDSELQGQDVPIYLIDNGVRVDHVEFEGRATTIHSFDSVDFDPDDFHGTGVGSIAVGKSVGVAPKAYLYSCRTDYTTSSILAALDAAYDHYVNSASNKQAIFLCPFANEDPLLLKDVFESLAANVIIIAGAGNDGQDIKKYPAGYSFVLSVGATTKDDSIASFSNYGSSIDVLAPGDNIYIADSAGSNSYRTESGTSFSCPFVSGVVASIIQLYSKTAPISTWRLGSLLKSSYIHYDVISMPTIKRQTGTISNLLSTYPQANITQAKRSPYMVNLSTGLKSALLAGHGVTSLLELGCIELYTGIQPQSADLAPTGILLGRVTNQGNRFSVEHTEGGLRVDLSVPARLMDDGNWVVRGVRSGTVGWWRWRWSDFDSGEPSIFYPRIDGAAGESLILPHYEIASTTRINIQSFTLSFED
jgi:hypothetical protein